MNSNKFNFFVPITIEKSGDSGEMKISGICSSVAEDSDGEVLEPTGFDFKPLLKSGFFNWNHQANINPAAIIGKPTAAKVINGGRDFYVEGILYKGSKEAESVYQLAQTLAMNDPDRQLGFSIEGQAIERDLTNPKRIKKAKITGVAITHCPKNPNTLLNIIKGEYEEAIVKGEEVSEEELKNKKKPEREEFETEEEFEKACKEFEKAMMVNPDLNPPSIDGVKTDLEKGGLGSGRKPSKGDVVKYYRNKGGTRQSVRGTHIQTSEDGQYHHIRTSTGDIDFVHDNDISHHDSGEGEQPYKKDKVLKKSEIFKQIFNYLENEDNILNKSQEIFKLTKKIGDMKKSEITKEVLEKAFSILELSKGEVDKEGELEEKEEITKKLPKDEKKEGDEEKEEVEEKEEIDNNDDSEEEELEKSEKISYLLNSYINKSKLTLEEATSKLIKSGYSKELVNKSIGTVETIQKSGSTKTTTGFELQIQELIDSNKELKKSLVDNQNEKFSAIGEILKSQSDTITSLQDQIKKIEDTPLPTKSVTRISAVDRFSKSESSSNSNNTLSLSNPNDRKTIANVLFQEVLEKSKQHINTSQLESDISAVEITKTISKEGQMFFKSRGFDIIG